MQAFSLSKTGPDQSVISVANPVAPLDGYRQAVGLKRYAWRSMRVATRYR